MAEPRNFVELRSEEVQEILGTPPGWLVRWGTSVALLSFCLLIGVAWFVRYPDVVVSDKLVITSVEPPVEVIAQSNGRIARIFVKDLAIVTEKQPLALLQNTARYEDLYQLDTLVDSWAKRSPEMLRLLPYPDSLALGELQADYAVFVRDLEDFKFGRASRSNSVQANVGSIRMQIRQLEESIAFEQKALRRSDEQLRVAEDFYERQKGLFRQGIISEMKLEEERLKVDEVSRRRDQLESNILEKNREIIGLRNSINAANFGQEETTTASGTRLAASLKALRSAIDRWKQIYVLSAPISGKAVFNGLKPQQYVREDEAVMTIAPATEGDILAEVQVPVEKSGKIKEGQLVVIKLHNYPYQEFGSLRGKVKSKSPVPKNREYTVEVDSISTAGAGILVTSAQKTIPFEQQLLGTAEFVTDDKGFLQRVVEQLSFQR